MKEFLLIFRRDVITGASQLSPEQLQASMKPWQDWLGSIAAQNKLAGTGNRLDSDGRVVRADKSVTNGPYVEIKEAIGGYIMVKAADINEATEIAKGCPIFTFGGNVEVRLVMSAQ
jgi:hypothetical protein